MMVQQTIVENTQRRWLPADKQHLLHKLYVTKADASYNLHATLGHMPYSRRKEEKEEKKKYEILANNANFT
jgi:hypothetical protein